MSWRRIVITMLVLVSTGVSLVGVAHVTQAAPQASQAPQVTFGAPKEGAKVTLNETSIDGPAIAWQYPGAIIAWTGVDAQHHINLMTSVDGLHYSNKRILPETSLWRPAVTYFASLRGAPYGAILLAWTGTDAHHTLNFESISTPDYKVTKKITFWGETSFTAPAIGLIGSDVNSDIYIAWAGTDKAHTLNVIHRTTAAATQEKRTLWGWSSISRPNLFSDLSNDSKGALILSWTGVNNRLHFAYSATDKTHWTMPNSSPLSIQSAWAPSMIGFNTSTQPSHWVAWTGSGTTSTRALNVQYTQRYPSWSDANTTATLNETAISGPALAIPSTGAEPTVLIGWTGVDYYHHLNVAIVMAPAASAPVTLGPQACPATVSAPAHWLPIIKPYSSSEPLTMEKVTCASMMGVPSLQALVTARRADQMLEVYTFNNITGSSPTLMLHLSGLVRGEAQVSGYSTVMTGEVDTHSSSNAGKSASAMAVDLFREFAWSATEGKMKQTVFPGMFPDLTRYQAEDEQASVNQGHQPWRLSATQVATTLAVSRLGWPLNRTTSAVVSGGGSHDVNAVVQVSRQLTEGQIGGSIKVTLSRLEGNTNGGIWEVIAVTADGLSLTSPASGSQLRSPVKVTGTGPAFEGVIGEVALLDHLYTQLGHARATGAIGMGQTTFSTNLAFTSSFTTGDQEGILVLSTISQADGLVAYEVMQKALISGLTS